MEIYRRVKPNFTTIFVLFCLGARHQQKTFQFMWCCYQSKTVSIRLVVLHLKYLHYIVAQILWRSLTNVSWIRTLSRNASKIFRVIKSSLSLFLWSILSYSHITYLNYYWIKLLYYCNQQKKNGEKLRKKKFNDVILQLLCKFNQNHKIIEICLDIFRIVSSFRSMNKIVLFQVSRDFGSSSVPPLRTNRAKFGDTGAKVWEIIGICIENTAFIECVTLIGIICNKYA